MRALSQFGVNWLTDIFQKWFISDCISLWRAYAILARPRWLLVASVVILIIEAGLYILNLILNSATRLPSVAPSIQSIVESNDWIAVMVVQSIATAFTAAVLVLSTALIGWRAWCVHHLVVRGARLNMRSGCTGRRSETASARQDTIEVWP
ncbi:hypothetical protein PENSPDRAFT_459154 [Peniophora sp. CONT]|nr:hypothetical protein PENSPDRAFT_459154 [Peniophora sp. CONT]